MNSWIYPWEPLQHNQISHTNSFSQPDCWLLFTTNLNINNSSTFSKFSVKVFGTSIPERTVYLNTIKEIESLLSNCCRDNLSVSIVLAWTNDRNAKYTPIYNKFIEFIFLLKLFLQNYTKIPIYICTPSCQNLSTPTNLNALSKLFGYTLANICKCIWVEHPNYPLYYLDYQSSIKDEGLLKILKKAPFKVSPLLAYTSETFYQPILKQHQLPAEIDTPALKISDMGVYIVVGGTGGIGQQVVYKLIELGAGKIIVISRNVKNNTSKINNTYINYYSLDVTNQHAVRKFFKGLINSNTALKGIFYVAGNLNDKTFLTMKKADFNAVWQVKSYGAWLFHFYSLSWQLEYFVLFSSISSSLGQAMQINYSTANGFLDALSYLRRNKQLVGQSLQWSPWYEVGMTESNENVINYAKARGVELINSEKGIAAFQAALLDDSPVLQIGDINWPLFIKTSANKRWPACLYQSAPKLSHEQLEYQVVNSTTSYYSALSFQQLEIWRYLQNAVDSTPYHIFVGLQTKKALNLQKIKQAIEMLIKVYELLKASFHTINDQPMIKINQVIKGYIELIDIEAKDLMETMVQQFQKSFRLDVPPLFKVCYFINKKTNEYTLCFVFHHLICDGYSTRYLIDQFIKIYNRQAILEPTQQYSDYIAWQWQYYKSENYFASINYLKKTIEPWYHHSQNILPLPVGGIVKTAIDSNVMQDIKNYARNNNTAPYYFILGCLIKVLAEFFNSNTVSIIVFLSGRNEDFQTVFGDTSNDAVMVLENCLNKSIKDITREIPNVVEIIKNNQNIRLEQLIAEGIEVPKISFDYQVIDNFSLTLDGSEANYIAIKTKQVPLWGDDPRHLSFKFNQYKTKLNIALKYRADIYTLLEADEIINKIVTKFKELTVTKLGLA